MKKDALILAESALSAAKTEQNKDFETRAYYTLGRICEAFDKKDKSEAYYDSAFVIAQKSEDNWQKGEIIFRKGVMKHNEGEVIKALEYFNESLQACRISNNYKIMGSTYSMIGSVYRVNGLYDRAIENIVNSKLNYRKAGFLEGDAWSSYLLGRIYADLKNPDKALKYFQDSLDIYSTQASIDGNQNGVAICFEQIGLLNLESGNLKEAHNFIDKTMVIYSESKSELGISNSQKNLGMIEYSMGNYELAEKYLNESLKVKNELSDILSLPTIYEYLGLCYVGKGQIKEGLGSLKQGLILAITNNQKKLQLNIYSKLEEVYLSINDLKNAIICQKNQI